MWAGHTEQSDKVIVAGDFKNIDQNTPTWFRASKLDRYLIPAAHWTPVLLSLHAHTSVGHRILRLNILIKPMGNTLSFLAARLCLEVCLSGYCTGRIFATQITPSHQNVTKVQQLQSAHLIYLARSGEIEHDLSHYDTSMHAHRTDISVTHSRASVEQTCLRWMLFLKARNLRLLAHNYCLSTCWATIELTFDGVECVQYIFFAMFFRQGA